MKPCSGCPQGGQDRRDVLVDQADLVGPLAFDARISEVGDGGDGNE